MSKQAMAFTGLQSEDRRLSQAAMHESYKTLAESITTFIEECARAGQVLLNPQKRSQVRSIIQYWATYRYQHTGVYQVPDLADVRVAASEFPSHEMGDSNQGDRR